MFFEDLPAGATFRTGSRALRAADIIGFAREWDPQPFHLDDEAARASPYGGLIASGWHTLLIAFKLTLEAADWSESSMGSPGMANVKWMLPVRPGDVLHVEAEVLRSTASRSRPDRGFVDIRYDVIRQTGETVAQYEATHMLRRRT
ncbi:MAG: MaoC family dehydratase [Rhodobacteraceae bacterium]|nr:MaoC family dehydratase [Paracoccaceae bacterium]